MDKEFWELENENARERECRVLLLDLLYLSLSSAFWVCHFFLAMSM